jgi:hypothetical protein
VIAAKRDGSVEACMVEVCSVSWLEPEVGQRVPGQAGQARRGGLSGNAGCFRRKRGEFARRQTTGLCLDAHRPAIRTAPRELACRI